MAKWDKMGLYDLGYMQILAPSVFLTCQVQIRGNEAKSRGSNFLVEYSEPLLRKGQISSFYEHMVSGIERLEILLFGEN